ncbi:MAG: thioredoxin fold domain-containing protein [Anaerolineaceae bacterium]
MAKPAETSAIAKPARQKRWGVKTWVIFLSIMLPVLAGGAWMVVAAERQTKEDPAVAALARSNAGGDIQVFTGAKHTVYQSVSPLPSAAAPRQDGKPTLVWFTTSNCSDCGRMDSFAHQAAAEFAKRMAFVEKAVDRDVSAARYGVSGTPTFVLIDARGEEIARFGFQSSREQFTTMIEQSLEKAGG